MDGVTVAAGGGAAGGSPRLLGCDHPGDRMTPETVEKTMRRRGFAAAIHRDRPLGDDGSSAR